MRCRLDWIKNSMLKNRIGVVKLKPSHCSIIEQLTLSGISLLLSALFIFFAEKEVFGYFSVLNSYLFLVISIQTAVITTPLVVEYNSSNSAGTPLLRSASAFCVMLALIGFLVSTGFELFFSSQSHPLVSLTFGFALFSSVLREYSRTIYLLEKQSDRSLINSLLYGTSLLVSLLGMFFLARLAVTIELVFSLMGFFGLAYSLPVIYKIGFSLRREDLYAFIRRLSPHVRWALPGVLLAWIQNNAYLTFLNVRFGASIVAEFSAARMLLMPYLTALAGYNRVFLSKVASELQSLPLLDMAKKSLRLSVLQAGVGLSLAGAFGGIFIMDIDQEWLKKYPDIFYYASIWALFVGATGARSLYTVLLQAAKKFNVLFVFSLMSAVSIFVFLVISYFSGVAIVVLMGLIFAEVIYCLSVFSYIKRFVKYE